MNKLEKIAKGILEEHPEKNAVYLTEDGQAFFNEDSAKNHSKNRGFKKIQPFFRSGVPTPQETSDAIKALEVAHEEVEASKSALEVIEKIFSEEGFEIEVTKDTNPVIALAASVKDQLWEAKSAREQDLKAIEDAAGQLVEKDNEIASIKGESDKTIAEKDKLIADLKKQLETAKKAK